MASKENVSDTTQELSPSSPASSSHNKQEGGFFPWLEDEQHKSLSATVVRRFPILGAVGLIGSAFTVFLSWLTLHLFKGHHVIVTGHMPKPAAWLSIILSLNSVLAHMAVSQGIAVSWWYRAGREKATVADLHNVWATGSSVVSAITSYKTFNYIALATVFVATLPINGILLQNSVVSTNNYKVTTRDHIDFGLASSLPAGFSATLNEVDGSIEQYPYNFQNQIPYLINNLNREFKSYNTKNTCNGECDATLAGIGFEADCKQSTVPFSLPNNNAVSNGTSETDIFSASFSWSPSSPYTVGMNTLFKQTSSCSGELIVNNCTLKLGKVKYPVQVQADIQPPSTEAYDWTWKIVAQQLSPSHASSLYIPSEVISLYTGEAETNQTRFGGIVDALKSFYDSRIYLRQTANGTSLHSTGQYAQQLPADVFNTNADGTPTSTVNKCNTSFSSFGYLPVYGDPTSYLLDNVRYTLFFTSIFAAEAGLNETTQTVNNTPQYEYRDEYDILWRWWAASVGVTFSIILFILPTFYGFWTLARSTTLSPLETARAFQAPVLKDSPTTLDTKQLLKEVGSKNLHTDMGADEHSSSTAEKMA